MNRRGEVAAAGHCAERAVVDAAMSDPDPAVRATALNALQRLGDLDDDRLALALADPHPVVRRRAAQLAATHRRVDLGPALDDADPSVIEMAAWACGEHELVPARVLDRLIALAAGPAGPEVGAGGISADPGVDSGGHPDPLVREAAVAALGAIGDERGLAAILAGCGDKPAIRRRAVVALAPFDGPEVDAAIERARTDKDWQVREAAEELLRAAGSDG